MLTDKRGISAVLVTVLIVLISIIAVGIAWVTIRGGIEQTTEQAGTLQDCLQLNLQIESAVHDSGEDKVVVRVKRSAGTAEMSKLKILVDGNGTDFSDTPDELETKSYNVTLAADSDKPEKIEIAGLLTGEKGDRTCGVADVIEGLEIV